ncbi:MAG TPA: NAD(P)H-dependent glycerol-3-phosphate dehydrogenase [Candidatus Kapabacteria bacterium]|nr:NAD(P)H-dependent glycerol-3-phosphate dehydrogenase [Candidatus Kapabacteria bacterium]HOM04565.1 NAD(P)H-dependent glycerol-3-phosphate dehydrogenase [Candidatus Kapabacteria bacterium]
MKNIFVIGAGGWGTTLANLLSYQFDVLLWANEKEVADEINSLHKNSTYLPGISLNSKLIATNSLDEFEQHNVIVNAVPTQYIRSVFSQLANTDFSNRILINTSKGIEQNTTYRISQIFFEITNLPEDNFVVLSGPSHAEEVSRKIPTTVVAASSDISKAKLCQELFSTPEFRVYTSNDVVGTEIGGALKNVLAIASGIIDGLGYGDNTKAALITRGLAEIVRLGVACGAHPWTFSGLSGLGDLFVTCNSKHSRNRLVGELIGKGKTLLEITSSMKMVAEGVATTISAIELGKRHNVELPITQQVYRILFENLSPKEAINELMTRESKHEWVW